VRLGVVYVPQPPLEPRTRKGQRHLVLATLYRGERLTVLAGLVEEDDALLVRLANEHVRHPLAASAALDLFILRVAPARLQQVAQRLPVALRTALVVAPGHQGAAGHADEVGRAVGVRLVPRTPCERPDLPLAVV